MIKFLSSWVKGLGLAIIIVSILEMLLPNNKTKKYVRIIMGIYILFTIISPFIKNNKVLSVSNINFEKYVEGNKYLNNEKNITIENRINELYSQELEKDITKKLKEKGYEVKNCVIETQIDKKEEKTKITKIKLSAQKTEKNEIDKKDESLENIIIVRSPKDKTNKYDKPRTRKKESRKKYK